MKNSTRSHLTAFSILLIPAVYLLAVYNSLPAEVPLHFNGEGKPDRYGDKSELVTGIGIMLAIGLGTYLLLRNIHKIDPKKTARQSAGSMNKIAFGMIILFAAINIIIISSAVTQSINLKIFLPILGLFIAYLGNVMYSVKPNYFFGIRTPWALEDEENWRKTHQLGGKLYFTGGILIALLSLILQQRFSPAILVVTIVLISLIPMIYSFIHFKKAQKLSHDKE